MRPTGHAHSDSIGYLSGCCAKIPSEVSNGGRAYSGQHSQWNHSILVWKTDAAAGARPEGHSLTTTRKPEQEVGVGCQPTPGAAFLPSNLYYLLEAPNHPKQHHQLGTKSPNVCADGRRLPSAPR